MSITGLHHPHPPPLPAPGATSRGIEDVAAPPPPVRWRLADVNHHAIDVAFALTCLILFAVMLLDPGQQSVPYHLMYIAFTLTYGFRIWPPRITIGLLCVVTVACGLLFLRQFVAGRLDWGELAEVPLMTTIVSTMAWHAHRAAAARRRVTELAAAEAGRFERQRDFLRDTAHAIRTPVTIARGNVELLQMGSQDPQLRADAAEVLRELDRLHGLARRLLVIEAVETLTNVQPVRVSAAGFVTSLGQRWAAAVPRRWTVECTGDGDVVIDAARLEESIDAVIDNALKYTDESGCVALRCRDEGEFVLISVGDSGPGIPEGLRARVFDRFFHRHAPGREPGNGLGLALVAAVAASAGGDVSVGDAPEDGALVTIRLPRAR